MEQCIRTITYSFILVAMLLVSGCKPASEPGSPTAESTSAPPIPPAPTIERTPTVSAEALSRLLWVSDPSLPQYDPQSSAYADFPGIVSRISDMGADAIDAADDLAVAIRFPRPEAYLAALALLKLGPDITATTASLLMDNLKNEKPDTRFYSAILLGSVGRRADCSVGNIAPLLWDADPSVRASAAIALERLTAKDLVPSEYKIKITQAFLPSQVTPDTPEGRIVAAARTWWDDHGSKVNWHPRYGLCDP
jgi:hypothetical protein